MIGVLVPSLRNPYFGDIVQRMQEGLPDNVSLSIMTAETATADQTVETLVCRRGPRHCGGESTVKSTRRCSKLEASRHRDGCLGKS